MNEDSALKDLHERKLRELIREYSRKNFTIFASLDCYELPRMIGNYRPDLIVKKDSQEIIMEIISKSDMLRSKEKLEYLSKYAEQHTNIRFDIVLTNLKPKTKLSESSQRSMLTSLRKKIMNNANNAYQRGEYSAAFLFYSNVLESLLEEIALRENVKIDKTPSLMELGEIFKDNERISETDRVLMQRILSERTRLAHFGFEGNIEIDRDVLIELRRLTSAIAKNLAS